MKHISDIEMESIWEKVQLSVQELSAMPEDSYQLVDIRDERARSYGVIPGSVALSAEELSESQEIDKNKSSCYLLPER